MSTDDTSSGLAIRSFVRRAGRLTDAQANAVTQHWRTFGLSPDGLLDFDAVFGRRAPRFLEIGFGMGDALLELAAANPGHDYVGVEVHEPGIGRLLRGLSDQQLNNVRVIRGDAADIVRKHIADASLAGVLVFFPDPWPKKRHHKRRLIQSGFTQLLADKLECGGQLHLATDWDDYACQMLSVLGAQPQLCNLAGNGCFARRPDSRPMTKFEIRGVRLGHGIWDLLFERAD